MLKETVFDFIEDEALSRGATHLTWLFWTKLCEKLSLERSFGYAEEEVQR
jgi:hypothetical protein